MHGALMIRAARHRNHLHRLRILTQLINTPHQARLRVKARLRPRSRLRLRRINTCRRKISTLPQEPSTRRRGTSTCHRETSTHHHRTSTLPRKISTHNSKELIHILGQPRTTARIFMASHPSK